MARKHSKSGKKRTHRHRRRQGGGGWGFTGASSIPGTPGIVSNPYVATAIGDCRAVQPGYNIPTSQYAASMKGLPGMSGGKRTRKMKGRKRTQKGGRYGFAPEMDPNANGQAWWAGSYAPIQRIACEGGSFNPLNPTHTPKTEPAGAAPPNYYFNAMKGLMSGGSRKNKKTQRGGQQMAPATYGVGNVDSMYYYAPTAGYANQASTWVDSVGAPVQIQVPFAARAMNQACLSTGGHPPLTGALQKGGRNGPIPNNGNNGQPPQAPSLFSGLPSLNNISRRLFGTGNTSVPDMSGNIQPAPLAEPESTNMPGSGAAAGPGPLPSSNGNPPQVPTIIGGRRHKNKKSRKSKHRRGGGEGNAAAAGAGAPPRGQPQQQQQQQNVPLIRLGPPPALPPQRPGPPLIPIPPNQRIRLLPPPSQ